MNDRGPFYSQYDHEQATKDDTHPSKLQLQGLDVNLQAIGIFKYPKLKKTIDRQMKVEEHPAILGK